MKNVVFVTGNSEKAASFSRYMGSEIAHASVDLDEIQTLDARALVEHKARQAYDQLKKPVLVEDVVFTFSTLGSLPGPFVKFFVSEQNGVEQMCRMLDGFEDRSATASCVYGYFDGHSIAFFSGKLEGFVTDMPRGDGGFGFDRIFAPNSFGDKTAAELTPEEYERYYTTIKPFTAVREFLEQL